MFLPEGLFFVGDFLERFFFGEREREEDRDEEEDLKTYRSPIVRTCLMIWDSLAT